jgi:hypothetical protein
MSSKIQELAIKIHFGEAKYLIDIFNGNMPTFFVSFHGQGVILALNPAG